MQYSFTEETSTKAKKENFLRRSGGRLPTRATKIKDERYFSSPIDESPTLSRVKSGESPRQIAERIFST